MSTRRVLLADDDPISRAVVEEMLVAAGYSVVECDSGEAAVKCFAEESFDAVLLDMLMPGINGLEACQRIREIPQARHVPIIIVTALEDLEMISRAFEVEATDFFVKPLRAPILINRLRLILDRTDALQALLEAEQLQGQAQALTGSGHWQWDVSDDEIKLSPPLVELLELDEKVSSISLDAFFAMVPSEHRAGVETAFERAREKLQLDIEHDLILASERRVSVRQVAAPSRSLGRKGYVVGTLQEITSLRRAERRVIELQETDMLTGLPNRVSTLRFLEAMANQAQRYSRRAALLILNINRFSFVDETFGHAIADKVLIAVAERIQSGVRGGHLVGTVGRLGEDSFGILLGEVRELGDAARVATRIHDALKTPFEIDEMNIEIGGRIGIASIPEDGFSGDTLLSRAESATRSAKQTGARISYYSEDMTRNSAAFLSLERDLREAVNEGQFFLVYQPLVHANERRVVGSEALIRWRHPRRGLVSPVDFIPVAEHTHLIREIGRWVLKKACADAMIIREARGEDLRMSVNVSPGQLRASDFAQSIDDALETSGLCAEALEIELTESAIMDASADLRQTLSELRERGIMIALDDFGTGYSSLQHLKRLPISTIKVDRSFVKDIPGDTHGEAISSAILAMASSMELEVVAEGVETEEQLSFFETRDCALIQGYFFSKPRELSDFIGWLDEFSS